MSGVNYLPSFLAVLFLVGCSAPQLLEVKQFQLRDQDPTSADEPMVRMEKLRHLRGEVSMEERRNRLGQYYTLIWDDAKGAGTGEVELTFEYQQGATASLVKRMVRKFPAPETKGIVDFAIIGDDYFKGGKVLAWKASLKRGGEVLATKQSYLWR
jgi:hypothetical protein